MYMNKARPADRNRESLAARGLRVVNLIGSPGAGKTALLEASVPRLGPARVTVLESDKATTGDAQRLAATGCGVIQLETGTRCHLDAAMVERGLTQLTSAPGGVVFVENVGSLACPACFDLGETTTVVVLSVAEGDDKPAKYPQAFAAASLFVLSKLDLLPYVPFDVERCIAHARKINPRLQVMKLSARTGQGMEDWCDWVSGPSTLQSFAEAAQ